MSETILTEKYLNKLLNRPIPFRASFHGDSTIIVDAKGRWATQQVPKDQARQIAIAMTEYVRLHRPFTFRGSL